MFNGWVSVATETQFQGVELLYRGALSREGCSSLDFLFGWRWLQLRDGLRIDESVQDLETTSTIGLYDRFRTKNDFNGAEFGVDWKRPLSCCWTFEMLGKVAFGSTHSAVRIDGQTTTVTQEGTSTRDGGLLALPVTNIGTHNRNSFAAVAEIGLSLRRRLACGWEATLGYNLVYWGDVLRAGDQVDLDLNLSQVPPGTLTGLARPLVPMKSTDFWAQGISLGFERSF